MLRTGYQNHEPIFETRLEWLESRGDRNENDLFKDRKGYFTPMSDGKGREVKVHLPDYLQN